MILVKLLVCAFLTYAASLLVPKRIRWTVLLVASVAFYAMSGIRAFLMMLLISACSFAVGRAIERFPVGSR